MTPRDAPALNGCYASGAALLDPFAWALRLAGMEATTCHLATAAEVADLGSSWAKRLGIPARRAAWLLTARQRAARPSLTETAAGNR